MWNLQCPNGYYIMANRTNPHMIAIAEYKPMNQPTMEECCILNYINENHNDCGSICFKLNQLVPFVIIHTPLCTV